MPPIEFTSYVYVHTYIIIIITLLLYYDFIRIYFIAFVYTSTSFESELRRVGVRALININVLIFTKQKHASHLNYFVIISYIIAFKHYYIHIFTKYFCFV